MISERTQRLPVLAALFALTVPTPALSWRGDPPSQDPPPAAPVVSPPSKEAAPAKDPSGIDLVFARTVRIQITRWIESAKGKDHPSEPVREQIVGYLLDGGERIATCGDVLDGAGAIVVETGDGMLRRARGASHDPQSGVGLVLVDAIPVAPSTACPIENPVVAPSLGDRVLVVGDPQNLGLAVTPGAIAAFDRAIEVRTKSILTKRSQLIQLAIACDDGDRGAPVATNDGRVIGLCLGPHRPTRDGDDAPAAKPSAVSFVVPIREVESVCEQLADMAKEQAASAEGRSTRPWLGVWAMDIHDEVLEAQLELAEDQGILIESVFPDSPAEAAGITRFDVISKIDGKPLLGTIGLRDSLRGAKVGQTIELEVIRKGKRRLIPVRLESAD